MREIVKDLITELEELLSLNDEATLESHLLNQNYPQSLSMGHQLCRSRDDDEVFAFLNFLEKLIVSEFGKTLFIKMMMLEAVGKKTIGHTIALSATKCKKDYLIIIRRLADHSLSDVISILSAQDNDGNTLGHLNAGIFPSRLSIVINAGRGTFKSANDAEAVQIYLNALLELSEIDPAAVIGIIAKQNITKDTIAHLIASKLAGYERYPILSIILVKILTKLASTHPLDVIEILKQCGSDGGFTIGQGFLASGDETIINGYLFLTTSLACIHPLDVLTLIQKESDGWYALSSTESCAEIAQKHLVFLSSFADTHSTELINFFKIQDTWDYTAGHWIARQQNAKTNKDFLELLRKLALKNRAAVYDILSLQTHADETIGFLLISYQNADTANDYLNLLVSLTDYNYMAVINILSIHKAGSHNSFGHVIVNRDNLITINTYLNLLLLLASKNPLAVIHILQLRHDANPSSTGQLILNGTHPEAAKTYVALLKTLMRTHPLEVIEILGTVEGKESIKSPNAIAIEEYLEFLKTILATQTKELIEHMRRGKNILHLMPCKLARLYSTKTNLLYLDLLLKLSNTGEEGQSCVFELLKMRDHHSGDNYGLRLINHPKTLAGYLKLVNTLTIEQQDKIFSCRNRDYKFFWQKVFNTDPKQAMTFALSHLRARNYPGLDLYFTEDSSVKESSIKKRVLNYLKLNTVAVEYKRSIISSIFKRPGGLLYQLFFEVGADGLTSIARGEKNAQLQELLVARDKIDTKVNIEPGTEPPPLTLFFSVPIAKRRNVSWASELEQYSPI